MKIFQIDFSKIMSDETALNWITSPEIGYGRNEERFWTVKTDANISNPGDNLAMYNLLMFLHHARINGYQTVLITKNV